MEQLIQGFIENRKRMAISALSIASGIAVLIGYFRSGPDALSYARAETAFSQWESAPDDEKLYLGMRKALQDVPGMLQKYEPVIAQRLFESDKMSEALLMAERSLGRVRDEVPFHGDYAATSLVIQRGSFQQALEQAVSLKERMEKLPDLQAGRMLYAYNLFRIASLQRELQNRPGEKAGWEELERYLDKNRETAEQFLENFAEEEVGLSEYISERKKTL